MRRTSLFAAAACALALAVPAGGAAAAVDGRSKVAASKGKNQPAADPVVVATLDSGTNPFHPCFRRDWDRYASKKDPVVTPRDFIPRYPANAVELPLSMRATYEESLDASRPVLDAVKPDTLYYVPGTNTSFYGMGDNAPEQLVDVDDHGARAASQIACEEFGLGANAHLVVLNWDALQTSASETDPSDPPTPGEGPSYGVEDLMDWAAQQPWIDVVHLNIENTVPVPIGANTMKRLIGSGKLVVVAAGNGIASGNTVGHPSEMDRWPGPPGSLIAGANDNGGWLKYSNVNPDVVMDGSVTAAAESTGFGETTFSGTSSSSPRITGYVAQVLGRLRARFGHTGEGLLTMPSKAARPGTGPLADGSLSAAELHEVIRKTADPNPHESRYDGGTDHINQIPQATALPFAFYPKMGYGEISEHTIDLAVRVLVGEAPMPDRAVEDAFFSTSRAIREQLWALPDPADP